MKVVFVGPTLPNAAVIAGHSVLIRPPAAMGDLLCACREGATVIGLVDGMFADVPSVWHKEILFALSQGVRVFGAASMGALRAAECAHYGMVGLGEVYRRYANGELVDDADVAQLHGPEQLGYVSLSEPLVNVIATLDLLLKSGALCKAEFNDLVRSARHIFFKKRTNRAIVAGANFTDAARRGEVEHLLKTQAVNAKQLDAAELLAAVKNAPDRRQMPPTSWTFHTTSQWARIL